MVLLPGRRLGPYEILSAIGAGGMGEVYRARDPRIGREVAIKVLPDSLASSPDRLRRFELEARTTGMLNHPNILVIYDTGVYNGSPYVVSELLQGETLRERLRGGALPLSKAVEFAIQASRGAAAAHERGMIHRDLKPENLFLTIDGHLKILDFGLAKFAKDEGALIGETELRTITAVTEPGMVLGTMGYMAPEQMRGQPTDHRADIFSLGAIFYEMLCGQRPFRGDSAADIMAAILREDPPTLTEGRGKIPLAAERVVRHCLEKNPADRFQSARDLAFDLESLANPSGIVEPFPTTSSRRKIPLIVVTAAILSAIATGAFLGVRQAQVSDPVYHWLGFRSGTVLSARFAPDGQTVVYSAAWDGNPSETFTTSIEGPESRPLGLEGSSLLSVSSKGEMAVLLGVHSTSPYERAGTLARVPLEGGAPREVIKDAEFAEWTADGTNLLKVRDTAEQDDLEFPPGKSLYETHGWIGHPRFSPQGDQIAFIDHADRGEDVGSVVVTDLSGHRKILSTGWTDLTGLAWSSRGDEVWFTGTRANSAVALMAVSLAGRERQVTKVPGDLRLFDIGKNGRVLMARDVWTAGIYALPSGSDKERNLSWFDFSIPDDLSADGSTLLFEEIGEGGGKSGTAYVRKTDGSVPVRLTEGTCSALSPRADWAICAREFKGNQFLQVPTGPGDIKLLPQDNSRHLKAKWLPDQKQILFLGVEPGHAARLYIQDVAGRPARAITPEGINPYAFALSPDGTQIAATMDRGGKSYLFPASGGEPRPISGLVPSEWPIGWSEDGRSIFIYRFGELPAEVSRFELTTGKRTPWKQLMPPDPTGINIVWPILLTPGGKSYAYGFIRTLSNLYVIEGLK